MSDFMIIFNWINLFAVFASCTYIIIKIYFFFMIFNESFHAFYL